MLDIEKKLDEESNYRNELLESLHLQLQQVKGVINKGVSPEEYNDYSKYIMALESSLTILIKFDKA